MRRSCAFLALAGILAAAAAAGEPERPKFPPIELTNFAGQTVELKNLLGRATVLNFWATWCGPCRMELPELQRLYNDLGGKGLVLLAVDVDLPPLLEADDLSQQLSVAKPRVESMLQRLGVSLPVYLVDGKTQVALGLQNIPFTVLLDRKGRVVRLYPGYSAESVADLRKQVLGVLAEGSGHGGK